MINHYGNTIKITMRYNYIPTRMAKIKAMQSECDLFHF